MSLVLQDKLALAGGGGGDVSNKVDKITDPSKVYATTDTGAQTGITYSTAADANTVVERNANAQVNVNLTPTENNNATSKKYVDDRVNAAIAEAVVFKGIVADETALPSSGNVNGDMYWITAFSNNPPTGMTAGNSGSAIYKGDPDNKFEYTEDAIYQPDEQTIDFNGNGKLAVQISATANNSLSSQNDGLYVDISGKVDKTTGTYKIYGTGNTGSQTTYTLSYTDATGYTIAQRSSDGNIVVATTPAQNTHATSKKYVDDELAKKVTANNAITGATKTKITYDAKGLVTAGANLEESDIPSLHLSKVTDVTATVTEVNRLSGVTSNVQTQLNSKQYKPTLIDITGLSVPLSVADNCIYSGGEFATLTFQKPVNALTTDYEAQVNFTSGSTPTVVTASDPIIWLGDNVNEDTGFQPRANCRYSIVFTYDGVNWCGMIRGVSL